MNQRSADQNPASEPVPKVRPGRREWLILFAVAVTVVALVGLAFWLSGPSTYIEYTQRGLVRMTDEAYAAAAEDFSAAIELAGMDGQHGEVAALLCLRATAYNASGEYQSVVDDVTEALRLVSDATPPPLSESDMCPWYLTRAGAYLELGDPHSAVHDVEVVLRHEPDNEHAREILASAQQRISDGSTGR